jgi:16S rRNA (cytidine1402-2'-O)-methyltransferase
MRLPDCVRQPFLSVLPVNACLYLIPSALGEADPAAFVPALNCDIIRSLRFFIVEDVRTARRFIRLILPDADIDSLTFFTLNKHTRPEELPDFLQPLGEGHSVGLLSEAGCPAVADPGADIVALAHKKNIHVKPLVGPSSILLAVMASGLNGQSFAFNGYLPVDDAQRTKAIRTLERRANDENQTQLFIETPYRNNRMMQSLIHTCRPATRLCIAANLTADDEFVRTLSIAEWKKTALPDLQHRPCIFGIL